MDKFSWETLPRPILALAPMEGYTDSPFRQIIKLFAPQCILYTEFSSADAISYEAKAVLNKISFSKKENPLIVQIFGKNPKNFATAAKIIEKNKAQGIDINMGCPAKKIINSHHGSAIFKNPSLAEELVLAIKENSSLPVSIKMRLGFEKFEADKFFIFCDRIIKKGINCIVVHGRTAKQQYSGEANYAPIYELKKQYPNTTIIGCGDINSGEKAKEKLQNLDGLMVGRATFGAPWIMAEIAHAFKQKAGKIPLTLSEKVPIILKHYKLVEKFKGEKAASLEMRKHLASYIKGQKNASDLRQRLVLVKNLTETKKILQEMLEKNA